MHLPKKSFGQHFLRDASVLEKIVAAAEIGEGDVVVEVGPGTGALTEQLTSSGSSTSPGPSLVRRGSAVTNRLVLIEADRDLIPALQEKFSQAEIILADAATVDYGKIIEGDTTLPFGRLRAGSGVRVGSDDGIVSSISEKKISWILVGNLPYNAGNAIVMHALQVERPPRRLVVMLQKEVGERMLGEPGAMSVLSVAVQLYAHVDKVCIVKPGAFVPPPKVDSMVLRLTPYASTVNREAVIALAKAGFAKRRKQLHKNLAEAGVLSVEKTKEFLKSIGLSELARAEELRVEDWVALCSTNRLQVAGGQVNERKIL